VIHLILPTKWRTGQFVPLDEAALKCTLVENENKWMRILLTFLNAQSSLPIGHAPRSQIGGVLINYMSAYVSSNFTFSGEKRRRHL